MREALARAARAVADCAGASVFALSDSELVESLDAVHRLEQQLAAVKLRLVRELDGRGVPVGQGCLVHGVLVAGPAADVDHLREAAGGAGQGT